jgi:hypothetical protein
MHSVRQLAASSVILAGVGVTALLGSPVASASASPNAVPTLSPRYIPHPPPTLPPVTHARVSQICVPAPGSRMWQFETVMLEHERPDTVLRESCVRPATAKRSAKRLVRSTPTSASVGTIQRRPVSALARVVRTKHHRRIHLISGPGALGFPGGL